MNYAEASQIPFQRADELLQEDTRPVILCSKIWRYLPGSRSIQSSATLGIVLEPIVLAVLYRIVLTFGAGEAIDAALGLIVCCLVCVLGSLEYLGVQRIAGEWRFESSSKSASIRARAAHSGLLILTLVPYFYFAGVLPALAAHQSIDLQVIGILFAIISRLAWSGSTGKSDHPLIGLLDVVWLFPLLILSAWLRLRNLDFNAPFIDELLMFEGRWMGNGRYIASDSRFWSMLVSHMEARFGLDGARAVTGLFGAATIGFLYLFTRILSHSRTVAFGAALVFSVSAPALYISNLATHDALALSLFAMGYWLLAEAIQRNHRSLFVIAAFVFFGSLISRFFIVVMLTTLVPFLWYAHGSKSSAGARPGSIARWFVGPLLLFASVYVLWNLRHIASSISAATGLSAMLREERFGTVLSALLLRSQPVLALLLVTAALSGGRIRGGDPRARRRIGFLLSGILIIPVIQILKVTDYEAEKNLAYSMFFGSIAGALWAAHLITAYPPNTFRRVFCGVSIPLFALALDWALTVALLKAAAPRLFEEKFSQARYRLVENPVETLFTTVLQLDQGRWDDPGPVLEELRALGLDRQRVVVFGKYGGPQISWYLLQGLGRDPNSGTYFSDLRAPQTDPFKYADEKKIPVVVAVFPEAKLAMHERVPEHPDYELEGVTGLRGTTNTYGRVLVFVHPDRLRIDSIREPHRTFFDLMRSLEFEIPNLVSRLQERDVRRSLASVDELAPTLHDDARKLAVDLERARLYAVIGNGHRASAIISETLETGIELPRKVISAREPRFPPYRIRLDRGEQDLRFDGGVDLLPLGVPGNSIEQDELKSNSVSSWLDFDPPIEIPAGVVIRVETTLLNSDVQAFRIVEKDQDFAERGWMETVPFASGRQVTYLQTGLPTSMKRFDIQFGPNSWGFLGGARGANVRLHSLTIHYDRPSLFGAE